VWDSGFDQEFFIKSEISPDLFVSSSLTHYLNIFIDSISLVTYLNDMVLNDIEFDCSKEWCNANFISKEGEEECIYNLPHSSS